MEPLAGDELRDRLAAIVDSSGDAIIGNTLDGTIDVWNRGAEKLFGYTAAEIVGQPIQVLLPLDRIHEESNILARISRGECVERYETLRVRKDGTKIDVSVTISPIRNGNGTIVGASKIARDITGHKRVEEALREKERNLSEAQRIAHIGSWTYDLRDPAARIVWSDELYRLYGVSPKTFVPTMESLFSLILGEDRPVMQKWMTACATGEEPADIDFRVMLSDGRLRVFCCRGELQRGPGNQPFRIAGTAHDITDRRQMEAALRESMSEIKHMEKRAAAQAETLRHLSKALENQSFMLQSVLDSMVEGLVAADLEGNFLLWNPAAKKLLGLGATNLPPSEWSSHYGMFLRDMATPIPPGQTSLERAIGGEASSTEIFLRNPGTNRPVWLEIHGSPLRDKAGLLRGGITAFRDITRRKADELEIRKLNQDLEERVATSAVLLAAIVASTDDAIISKTLAGIITSWNASAERMFGFDAFQAIDQHINIIVPPDKRDEELFIRGEDIRHFETVRISMSGQRIPVELTVSPLRNGDGRLIGVSNIMRDVTQRKEIEAERHQAEAQLRAVLDYAVDGIITIDACGNVESFNPACTRIFGYESEEMIGKNIRMLMPEPYHSRHEGYLSRYAATGESSFIGTAGREVVGRRKDSSVFAMDLSVSVFELEDGKHYSGIVRDITSRKAAEAERAEAAMELIRYTAALERSNQELDAFAYAASHDLKAPLRVIHNASVWIEEDLAGNLTNEIRENMTLLRSRVRRMDKLLDDLLTYSRIGRETDSNAGDVIVGTTLIENIMGLLSLPQGFIVEAASTFAGIQVFCMPLQQILINLISNAIKHHDKKEGRIEVSVEDLGAMFRFSVKDDGPGIPEQYHEQIFGMFQTLKPRDQVEGSGMGLAMVRKHVDVAGGVLTLDSDVGKGSTFSFTWPKQDINKQKPTYSFARVEEA